MNRIYYSLKLFYDKELTKEANREDMDSIRSYYVVKAYCLDKLHVLFSRRKIAEWLGYLFLIMALIFFLSGNPTPWVIITAGISIAAFIRRFYYVQQYRRQSRCMNLGLTLLKNDVFKTYKIYINDSY